MKEGVQLDRLVVFAGHLGDLLLDTAKHLKDDIVAEVHDAGDDGVKGGRTQVENLEGNTTLAVDLNKLVAGVANVDVCDTTKARDRKRRQLTHKGARANRAVQNARHFIVWHTANDSRSNFQWE